MKTYTIDGARFSDLEGFFEEVSSQVIPGVEWGKSLNAFNDILRGGFGTPEDGFSLRWENSELSRVRLGWDETIRSFELSLRANGPAVKRDIQADLEAARRHQGKTLFEVIVDIIRTHGPGGNQAHDRVDLVLA